MKLLKLSSISLLILSLLFLATPLKSTNKADAAGRLNLQATLDKTRYTVGDTVTVTATGTYVGSDPNASQRIVFTSKLVTSVHPSNPEYTVLDRTMYGAGTWNLSGAYSYTVPNEGWFYIQIKAIDMSVNLGVPTLIEQVNSTTIYPASLPAPVVTVTADSMTIPANTSTTIRWSATNSPYSCIRNDTGAELGPGSSGYFNSGNLGATKTFTITCYN